MATTATLRVHPKLTALVDAADIEELEQYRWFGKTNRNGRTYVQVMLWDSERKKSYPVQLSRMIARPKKSQLVSFKNDNPVDCRRENLQIVTRSDISRHLRKVQSAKYKGVQKTIGKWVARPWKAKIRAKDKHYYLGRYAIEEEAARAYDAAAMRYFGKAARLNLPNQLGERRPTTYREITCPVCNKRVSTNQPRQKYCEKDGYCANKYRRMMARVG